MSGRTWRPPHLSRVRAVRTAVKKFLFAHMLAGLPKGAVERELFRQGVLLGSLVAAALAPPALRSLWPREADASRVARFVRLVGYTVWYALVDQVPSVRAEPLDARGLVWAEVRGDPGEDAFYRLELPLEVGTLFFVAGAYEGALQEALRLVGAEGEWYSLWRPLGGEGVCGFCSRREIPAAEVAAAVERRCGSFFRVVGWGDSAAYLRELLGFEVPSP